MPDETTDPKIREALEWFVRMRDDKASPADRQAFEAWLNEDEQNPAALAQAEALWKRFDIVQPEIEQFRRSRTQRTRRGVLLGCAGMLVGASGLYLMNRPDLFADHITDVGERRTVTLADGSMIELGSYSALSVNFSMAARQIVVHRGEALFDVATDAARPFVVEAGDGTAQALGTRFDLKYVDDLVTVAVDKHAVLVRTGARPSTRIDEGWQASYIRGGALSPITQADLETTLAWRQDRIIFQDVPLRRVLSELERYRRGRIVLMDSKTGDIPVTAIFSTRQIDNALQTIESTMPVRILRATPFVTVVYPG